MTFAVLLPLVLKYAPEAVALIEHLVINIAAGRSQATVADADWAEIDRLGAQTADLIFLRRGIAPPKPAA